MAKLVEIPNVGEVEFPDTMTQDEINAASKKLYEKSLSQENEQKTKDQETTPPKEAENIAREIRNTMVSSQQQLATQNQQGLAGRDRPSLNEIPAIFDAPKDPDAQMLELSEPGRIRELMDSPENKGPSGARIATGLATEIVVGEGAKIGMTSGGAAIGTAIAPGPGTVIGAGVGYVTGAITGGLSGSIAAQKIEGRENTNWGRVVVDVALNLIPGGKISKGPKALVKASEALVRNRVKTGIATGAVAGPIYSMTETLYREDRFPSWQEMTASGLTAAALGAGLGISSKKAEDLFLKFSGKSRAYIDQQVLKGDADAVTLVNVITDTMSDPKFKEYSSLRGYIQDIGNYAKANVAPSLRIGDKATQSIIDAGNIAAAGKEAGGLLGIRINEKIQKSEAPEEVAEAALEYLVGKRTSLPVELKSLQDDLTFARKSIREYQMQLIDNHNKGQRILPDETFKAITRSLDEGDYLTQSYRFFNDMEYKPSKEQTDALHRRLVKDGMTPEDANAYMAQLNGKRAGSPTEIKNFITGGPSTGVLKRREDLSDELRSFLGEYLTPGEKVSQTMSKVSRLAAYDTADRNIADALIASGELVPASHPNARNLVPIKLRTGEARFFDGNEAQQLYGDESLQVALQKLYTEFDSAKTMDIAQNVVSDAYQTLVSAGKFSKVPMNIPSYMVNLYGNFHTMAGMGMNPFLGVKKGARLATADMSGNVIGALPGVSKVSKNMLIEQLAELKTAKELGLVSKNVVTQDIITGTQRGSIGTAFNKVSEPIGKLYSAPDTLIRSVVQSNHVKLISSVAPSASPEVIEKVAAKITNATYQNYDRVSQPLKTLSRHGLVNQFATFWFEFARNQFNQVRLASEMVNGTFAQRLSTELGTPVDAAKIRIEGIKRVASLSALYGGYYYGLEKLNRRTTTEEQEKALRETVLPDYTEKSSMAIKLDDDGNVQYAGASYIVPHLLLVEPAMNAIKAETSKDAAVVFASSLHDNLKGEGSFAAQAIMSTIFNTDLSKGGRTISSEPQGSPERLEDQINFFAQALLEPGTMREIRRAKTQPMSQTAMRAAGIRVNDTSIADGFSYKAGEIRKAYQNEASKLTGAKRRFEDGKLTFEDYQAEVVNRNQTLQRNHDVMVNHVNNLIGPLKQPEDSVIEMLKDSGFGSEDILGFLENKFEPKDPNKPKSIGEIFEANYANMDAREIAQELRELSAENPSMAKRIADHYKSVEKDKRAGVTGRVALMRSLSTDKRAERVFNEMQQSQDADGVLRKYMEMGVVNKDVYMAIDLLRQSP